MKIRNLFFSVLPLLIIAVSCTLPGFNQLTPDAENVDVRERATSYEPITSFSWFTYASDGQDQKVQGPCYIFAAVAQTEAMVRLYYNRPRSEYNINLSEKAPYSVWSAGLTPAINERRTYIETTLKFIKQTGLVLENSYRYEKEWWDGRYVYYGYGLTDAQKATLSNYIKVKIPDYKRIYYSSETQLKQYIITYGPVSKDILGHGYVIAGWRKASDGKTEWEIVSDSWPKDDPDPRPSRHYFLKIALNSGYIWVIPVSSQGITCKGLSSVTYHDNDKDGYYFWGIGPKPAGCPGYAEHDGDDNDAERGPISLSNLSFIKLTPKQSFEVSSWGATVARKTVTVQASGKFYWDYYSYEVPGSGYYMRIVYNGAQVVYADEHNMKKSGSFAVQKGKSCTVTVMGGYIAGHGSPANFYGRVRVHN
jgi:hypothetical protein